MTKINRNELKSIAAKLMAGRHYHIEWHGSGRTVRPMAVIVPHDGSKATTMALRDGQWLVWA